MLTLEEVLQKPEQIVVVYHKDCMDGFGAAYCAWKVLGNSATYLPQQYGEVFQGLPPGKCSIIMVDVSFNKDIMEMVAADHNLVVLDHHKTAQEVLTGADYALFDMNKSGAMLAYEYFRPQLSDNQYGTGEGGPEFIRYIQDRDLWQWKMTKSREFSAGLQSYPFDFNVWSELDPYNLILAGEHILRFSKQQVDRAVKYAHPCSFDDTPGMIANSCLLQSEIGEAILAKFPETKFACIEYDDGKGKQRYSLRSRTIDGKPEVDVGAMAKKMGGGGHASAAGFEIPIVNEAEEAVKPAA